MNPLGRGLGSLIPDKEETPNEVVSLDVLAAQEHLDEPVYRFHDAAAPTRDEHRVSGSVQAPDDSKPPSPPESSAFGQKPKRTDSIFWIEVSKIEPNPLQPRRVFDIEELTELANSIREHGILQPLLVSKVQEDTPTGLGVRYQLIAGERRWRAAKLAGLREIPVIVKANEISDLGKLELALIENVQREDLNPLERARAFQKLVDEFGLMQKEIAERIGKSRESVANALRILRLPEDMQAAIAANKISEGHARVLLTLESNPAAQRKLYEEIIAGGLTTRDAETTARLLDESAGARRGRGRALLDPDTRELKKRLEEAFGTRVSLVKKGEKGKIVLEFYSSEELQGILNRVIRRENL